jgi:hypothetical protein
MMVAGRVNVVAPVATLYEFHADIVPPLAIAKTGLY